MAEHRAPTAKDLEILKREWRRESCWDIEETGISGEVDYTSAKAELYVYRLECEKAWQQGHINKLEKEIATLKTANTVLTKEAEPHKVKIIKGQKDTYGWEIGVKGADIDAAIDQAIAGDKRLRQEYKDKLGGA